MTTIRSNVAVAQTNLAHVYDDLNRLTQATRPLAGDPNETFQYDPTGNRLNRDGQAVDSVFDDANRLLDDTAFTYTYDANGNLTQKTDKATGEVTDYTWDVLNQLVKVEQRSSAGATPIQTVLYKYDAVGRRIQKDVNGTLTKYIYDGPNILLEYDSANLLVARYTQGPGIDEPLVMNRSGVDYFYQADGLGSITELTNSAGTILQSYIYDSFGNISTFDQNGAIISIENGIINPFTYTGREFDVETGLYYNRARYYDSLIGRFISEDPIGFDGDGPNLYIYTSNDPIDFVDLNGQWTNPTGGGVRNDHAGQGGYEASRGSRTHAGTDFEGAVGGDVVAPLSGSMEILGNHTTRITSRRESGVQHSVRMKHIEVPSNLNKGQIIEVKEGDTIATILDPLVEYPDEPRMTPHAHVEVYKIDKNGKLTRINPLDVIPLPKPLPNKCGGTKK